jgi:two-component system, NarL family, nitrate/nitrite response regulator NarL
LTRQETMNSINKSIRIMIVDDHHLILWGLEKVIESEKPRMAVVATASSCKEALAGFEKEAPHIILLDLDLGESNGLDILPALTANATSKVLVLTGEREEAVLDAAVLRGARGVIRKDISADQLLKAIEKVHQGELWIDRDTLGRVFGKFANPVAACKPDSEMQKISTLTMRERNIIHMIIEEEGASNKIIAKKLCISESTLRNHLTSIYHKLGVINRLELYVYASKRKISVSSNQLSSNNELSRSAQGDHQMMVEGYAFHQS